MSYRDKASKTKLKKKEKAAAAKGEEASETGAVSEDTLTGRDLFYMLGTMEAFWRRPSDDE
jgi:hypothetical protein